MHAGLLLFWLYFRVLRVFRGSPGLPLFAADGTVFNPNGVASGMDAACCRLGFIFVCFVYFVVHPLTSTTAPPTAKSGDRCTFSNAIHHCIGPGSWLNIPSHEQGHPAG